MRVAEQLKGIKNDLRCIVLAHRYAIKVETIVYANIVYVQALFIDGSVIEIRIYQDSIIKKVH